MKVFSDKKIWCRGISLADLATALVSRGIKEPGELARTISLPPQIGSTQHRMVPKQTMINSVTTTSPRVPQDSPGASSIAMCTTYIAHHSCRERILQIQTKRPTPWSNTKPPCMLAHVHTASPSRHLDASLQNSSERDSLSCYAELYITSYGAKKLTHVVDFNTVKDCQRLLYCLPTPLQHP